jgi:hypothetical protein
MDGDATKARRYRERAQGLRSIAEDMPPGNAQRIILSLAVEYERLARLLDEGGGVRDDPIGLLAALKKPDDSS